MYILHELWRGNLSLSDRDVPKGSRYARALAKATEQETAFCDLLSPEQRKEYNTLCNHQTELLTLSEEDSFIMGFRLGAKLMLDIQGDPKAPLYDLLSTSPSR